MAFAAATALAWVSWVVWPVQMIYPHLTCGGVSCGLVEHMQRIDHGTNIFPSLHASHSMLVVAIFLHYRHRYWRLVALVAAAVVTAAVLVGQHYVIDVLVGLALGIWAWKFAEKVVAARAPGSLT